MMLRIIAYFRPAANFFSHWQPLHLPQAPRVLYNGEHPFHPQEVPMTISAIDTGSVLYFSHDELPTVRPLTQEAVLPLIRRALAKVSSVSGTA